MKRLLKGNVWLRGGTFVLAAVFALAGAMRVASAQGVTTGSVAGMVKDAQGLAVPGATVTAVHEPSGTTYEAYTLADGRFSIQGMRVGGPYAITANLTGFQPQTVKEIYLSLGMTSDVALTLGSVALSEEVTVSGKADPIFSSERTGAGTAVNREAITTLPTISNRLESFVKLTPQARTCRSAAWTTASTTSPWTAPTSTTRSVWAARLATARVWRRSRWRPSKPCRSTSPRTTCARATSLAPA